MNDLEAYFQGNAGRLILKWRHYFRIYERHLAAYRDREVTLIEFGVLHGGSLQMWRHYLGPKARIVGVDRNPDCARLAEPGIDIVIGDQADPALHQRLRERYAPFHVVIDDGGHRGREQITTFAQLYPVLEMGGVYLVEDTHTSYMAYWGGGIRAPGTFIEFAKGLVDQLHAWYGGVALQPDLITHTAYALHFYDSLFVVEKERVDPPQAVYSGHPAIPQTTEEAELIAQIRGRQMGENTPEG